MLRLFNLTGQNIEQNNGFCDASSDRITGPISAKSMSQFTVCN